MANRPTNTLHLYEESEMVSMQQKAIRKGRISDAVFAVIERDVSGHGNAAFRTLFTCVCEDIGLAKPTAVTNTLLMYNRWSGQVNTKFEGTTGKSFQDSEARKFLVTSTVQLARCPKSRIVPWASVVSIKEPIEQMRDLDPKEFEIDAEWESTLSWVDKLGAPTADIPHDKMIDVKKVGTLFVIFLIKTNEVWGKIALKKSEEAKVQKDPSYQPNRDVLDDEEATEEVAIQLETALLSLVQMLYAVDTIEQRRIPKSAIGTMPPSFIQDAMTQMEEIWFREFSKISSKAEKAFSRPIVWVFATLCKKAQQEKSLPLIRALLTLLEMTARELGGDRLNLLCAVLFTVRNRVLDWSSKPKWDPTAISTEPEIENLMALYDSCLPESEGLRDPVAMSNRRQVTVLPEYVDKHTFRGRGRNTADLIKEGADALKLDISSWSEDEKAKSHGPGIILAKKRGQMDTLTFMEFFLKHGASLDPKQKVLEDHYEEKASKIYLAEEDAYNHEKASSKYMSNRKYVQWIEYFGIPTTKKVTKKAASKKAEEKVKKSKPPPKSKSTTTTPKKGTKKTTPLSIPHEIAETEDNVIGDDEVEEVVIVRHKQSSSNLDLHEGKRMRIKTIVYETDSDQEGVTETSPKKVTLRRASSSSKSQEREGEEESDEDDEERVNKKIEKYAQIASSGSGVSAPAKRPRSKVAKSSKKESGKKSKEESILDNKPKPKSKKTRKGADASVDLVTLISPRTLTDEEIEEIANAPLAQTPTGNAKKFIYVTSRKVYKGPYKVNLEKDVSIIQRTLYRVYRMKHVWGDSILIEHELVHDAKNNILYFCMDNIGNQDPELWTVEEKILSTHAKESVDVLTRKSSGVLQMSKMIQSPIFELAATRAVIDLAARYLIGAGDAHLANIICSEDGNIVVGVDIEDDRGNMPLSTDKPPPSLINCLFVKGKTPSNRDINRFYAVLPDTLESLDVFLKKVRNENLTLAADFATKIGWTKPPSQMQINARLVTLETCLKGLRKSHEGSIHGTSSVPPIPGYEDDNGDDDDVSDKTESIEESPIMSNSP